VAQPNLVKCGVFPLEHMDAPAHEYLGLIEIMPPDTVHGIRTIIKPYFIKVSSDLEYSSDVIQGHFGHFVI